MESDDIVILFMHIPQDLKLAVIRKVKSVILVYIRHKLIDFEFTQSLYAALARCDVCVYSRCLSSTT